MSLLITCRTRHVPPSGANVSPVRRTFWISLAMPTVNASTRSDGNDNAHVAAALLLVDEPATRPSIPEKSAVRERRERDLVVPGAAQPVLHHGADLVGGALAHRAGDHPGLAEAAAARAAPEHLDVEAVVHDLDERHELVLRVRPLAEVGDGALVDAIGHVGEPWAHLGDERAVVRDLVHRRHVDARDRRQLAEHALAAVRPERFHAADDLGDLADGFLAVADHERVDEVGHRLRVERAVAADDDERVLRAALLGPHRDPGEVEALQHVGVDELGGESEGEHVEVARVVVGVDREERHARGPHLGVHVDPRRVGAFGHRVVTFVEDLVEDLEPLVG